MCPNFHVAQADAPIPMGLDRMRKRFDFYTVAGPLALVVGFVWVYLTMTVFKIPGWPAMVGMAAYYAVGGLACHKRCDNGPLALKGLMLGVVASWIGVAIWTGNFRGNPVAMGLVMGIAAMIFVLATKVRFLGSHQFIAMPQAFLGATIFFGLFSTFMIAKGPPAGLLFGWLQPLAIEGPAQPHIAGVLAVVSVLAGVLLGLIHQNAALAFSGTGGAVER